MCDCVRRKTIKSKTLDDNHNKTRQHFDVQLRKNPLSLTHDFLILSVAICIPFQNYICEVM